MFHKTAAVGALALAALGGVANAATCNSYITSGTVWFTVVAEGVPDIPGICGGLWDNLNGFGECAIVEHPECRDDNGALYWKFSSFPTCNGGSIEATWWEATKNQWGAINC